MTKAQPNRTSDLDTYRAAQATIETHGEGAAYILQGALDRMAASSAE